jgi:Uncharacterized proteins, homologs of microcin C7 resistance protein MccF
VSAPGDVYLDQAPLVAGDHVALVAPSGPGSDESISRAVESLEGWGLVVSLGRNIHATDPHFPYLAGTDRQRLEDLVAAWTDPTVDAVVCLRGGYGAMRLLDSIDWDTMRRGTARPDGRPKLLTGSSDITALHEAWSVHLGVPTLFSPMPGNDVFRDSGTIRGDVHRWLFEPWAGRSLVGPRTETLVPGDAEGIATGGNLSLLAAAIGAPEHHPPTGAVVFLEDVGEEPYRLDNLMLQLQRSGWLGTAAGVVLGSWEDCGDLEQVRRVVAGYVADLGVPVLWEEGFGHDPDALSVPLHVPVTLHAPGDGKPDLRVGVAA